MAIPGSLKNIYKSLNSAKLEHKFNPPNHGDLTRWSQQGILLLNTGLTVEKNVANGHKDKIPWSNFTNCLIESISHKLDKVVFILWGNDSRAKRSLINNKKHKIIEANHPSPLSANKPDRKTQKTFFDSDCFTECEK